MKTINRKEEEELLAQIEAIQSKIEEKKVQILDLEEKNMLKDEEFRKLRV